MSKKRMTLKEFKQIFTEAGFDMDVWGYEGILNMIAGYNSFFADQATANGQVYTAKDARERALKISTTLLNRGYYDN